MEENKRIISIGGKGIGFVGLLQLAFIILKLCGVITWGWVLVLLPAIIYAGFIVLILLCVLIGAIIYCACDR